jgi:hypothetical protein
MKPESNGQSVLGATNYAWLKEYMAVVRERVERDRVINETKSELTELKHENMRLKLQIAHLSQKGRRSVTSPQVSYHI